MIGLLHASSEMVNKQATIQREAIGEEQFTCHETKLQVKYSHFGNNAHGLKWQVSFKSKFDDFGLIGLLSKSMTIKGVNLTDTVDIKENSAFETNASLIGKIGDKELAIVPVDSAIPEGWREITPDEMPHHAFNTVGC